MKKTLKNKILFSLAILLGMLCLVATAAGCGLQDPAAAEKQAIIDRAVSYQTEGGVYHGDKYQVVKLKKGDTIYGMLPGQSVFYTDKATLDLGQGSYKRLYNLMQIRPHPVYGYRTKAGKYRVLEDIYVAAGLCQANSTIIVDGKTENPGEGGGYQYVVFDYTSRLILLEETILHE
jgi:hypothetical protein